MVQRRSFVVCLTILNDILIMEQSNSLLIGLNDQKKKLFADEGSSTFVLAPHGSGKSVAFIIPNLLTYAGSMVVHDIKGEAYLITNEYRKSIGQTVVLWKPLCEEMSGKRLNPFDSVSKDAKKAFSDLQKLVSLLIKDEYREDFKNITDARELLVALTFQHLVALKKKVSLGVLARVLFGDFRQEITNLTNLTNNSTDEISNMTKNILSAFIKRPEKKQDKIIAVLKDYLELYLNPFVDYATSESDFKPEDLYTGKVTIYVSTQPAYMDFLSPLMRFFYEYMFFSLMKYNHTSSVTDRSSICFVLDEFYSLGQLRLLQQGMPYFRSYKIQVLAIANTFTEVSIVYGTEDMSSLLSLFGNQVFFKPADMYSASVISGSYKVEMEDLLSLTAEHQIMCKNITETHKTVKCSYYNDSQMKSAVKQIIV